MGSTKKYPWQEPLLDAFLAFEPEVLKDKLRIAEPAITGHNATAA